MFAGRRSQLAGVGKLDTGPGRGEGSCAGGDVVELVLGGQKGCGSRQGGFGSTNGGGVVVVVTGVVLVGVDGVVVGVVVSVSVGSWTRVRGTQV